MNLELLKNKRTEAYFFIGVIGNKSNNHKEKSANFSLCSHKKQNSVKMTFHSLHTSGTALFPQLA